MKKLLIIFLAFFLGISIVWAQGFEEGLPYEIEDMHFDFPQTEFTAGDYQLTINCGVPLEATAGGYSLTIRENIAPVAQDLPSTPVHTPEGISPNMGTQGSLLVINGTGFGTVQGKVYVGGCLNGIQSWGDTKIITTVNGYHAAGTYPVEVVLANGEPRVYPDSFIYLRPALVLNQVITAVPGEQLTLKGLYFGSDKSRLTLYMQSKAAKYNKIKILPASWVMEPVTGVSSCIFIIPLDITPGAYSILLWNTMGWSDAAYDGITIQ